MSNTRPLKAKSAPEAAQPKSSIPLLPLLLTAGSLGYGLYRAIELRWISDDAFITMRYVKNFLDGNGLVYNVGERVEGYTHFLWLLLLSFAGWLGFDPVDASQWLGIAAYAGTVALLVIASRRMHSVSPRPVWIPLAAILFSLNYDNAIWASGGLETALYTLLLFAAFFTWFFSRHAERRRLQQTGLLLALAALTRPDGVLFIALAVVLLVVQRVRVREPFIGAAFQLAGPSLVLGIPYLLWKLSYYGDIFPATYYAKSGGANYYSQGFFYLWLYFRVYITSALALIAAFYFIRRQHSNATSDAAETRSWGSADITAFAAILVYFLLYVARVGGDFMFARFIIPVVPLIAFEIERGWNALPVELLKYRVTIALALVAAVLAENNLRDTVLFHHDTNGELVGNWDLAGGGSTRGIADERWVYYRPRFHKDDLSFGSLEAYSIAGKSIAKYFEGLPITVAVPGASNMTAYYGNFANCINEYGLTDTAIAHMPTAARGRIGHEKKASEEYLRARHVDLELASVVAEPPQGSYVLMLLYIPELGMWQQARIVTYNKDLMNRLAEQLARDSARAVLPLYERILPNYMRTVMPTLPLARLEENYDGFRRLYFDRYPDTALQHSFENRIAALRMDSAAHAHQ